MAAAGIGSTNMEVRMAQKKSGRRYTAEQKQEVIRRVQGGETQAVVAKEAGMSAWTVGQWVRGAKGGAKAGRKPGRPRGRRSAPRRAGRTGRRGQEIVWSLDGDLLVLRIPLGRVVRRIAALQVLAAIKRELGR
jgi:transposase-like protein